MDDAFLKIGPDATCVWLDARSPAFYSNPNPVYRRLHDLGAAFFWTQQNRWYFIGYDAVNGILRDRRFGRQITHIMSREDAGLPPARPHLEDFDRAEAKSLLELEPPEHTRLRTLVNRAFVSRHIEKLRPEIAAMAHELIDGFAARGRVELISAFAETIPVSVIARMMGVPLDMSAQLLAWSHDYVRMYQFAKTPDDELRANRAAREFADYILQLSAEKRKAPKDDLLSLMLQPARDGQLLTGDELVSTAIVLLNAGHEATVHQIGSAVRTILQSGMDPVAITRDAGSTERLVEECLRISAPVHIFDRWVLEDLDYEGVSFRKGDRIGLILAAANLDPARFSDPLAFCPARNEGQNLSFGAGIHFCIGAPLARLELNTVLPILFERLPGVRLAADPKVRDIFHFHGLERLDLAW